jgi:hypothetical protein
MPPRKIAGRFEIKGAPVNGRIERDPKTAWATCAGCGAPIWRNDRIVFNLKRHETFCDQCGVHAIEKELAAVLTDRAN